MFGRGPMTVFLTSLLVSGCLAATTDSKTDPANCDPAADEQQVLQEAARWLRDGLDGKVVHTRSEGTLRGAIFESEFMIHPTWRFFSASYPLDGVKILAADGNWSHEENGTGTWGRDYRPEGAMHPFYQAVMLPMRGRFSMPKVAPDGTLAGTITCVSWTSPLSILAREETALRIQSEGLEGQAVDLVVSRQTSLPLYLNVRDSALQTNLRTYYAHGDGAFAFAGHKPIGYGANGQRTPPQQFKYDFVLGFATHIRTDDWHIVNASFGTRTDWIPLADINVHHILHPGAFEFRPLRDGREDFKDGDYFEYRDRDGNNFLSKGDTFMAEFGTDRDFQFFDGRALKYADRILE